MFVTNICISTIGKNFIKVNINPCKYFGTFAIGRCDKFIPKPCIVDFPDYLNLRLVCREGKVYNPKKATFSVAFLVIVVL